MGAQVNVVKNICSSNSFGTNVLRGKLADELKGNGICPITDELEGLARRERWSSMATVKGAQEAPVVADFRKFCRGIAQGDKKETVRSGAKLATVAIPGMGSSSTAAKLGAQISKKQIVQAAVLSSASAVLNNKKSESEKSEKRSDSWDKKLDTLSTRGQQQQKEQRQQQA